MGRQKFQAPKIIVSEKRNGKNVYSPRLGLAREIIL
jgi:hypothetical protein